MLCEQISLENNTKSDDAYKNGKHFIRNEKNKIKTMRNILTTFVFVSMTLAFMVNVSEAKTKASKPPPPPPPSLMDVIQSILKDPEFLALSLEEQLPVLITIHNFLKSEYENRKIKIKKRDMKNESILNKYLEGRRVLKKQF